MNIMGKAGQALKQVLEAYSITQSQLAAALGVERPIVFRWFHGNTDPTAETVAGIVQAIQEIDPKAASAFIQAYLGEWLVNEPEALVFEPKQLPTSEDLNIPALSRVFKDRATSYKYLFFIALLDILKRRQFDVLSPISFQEIIVEMLANAWYPHTYFKLSFGSNDQIAKTLDSLSLQIDEPILKFTDTDKKLLRKTISSQDLTGVVKHLTRYVPFRLIIPFLEDKLEGVSRAKGNDLDVAMPSIAENFFEGNKPLYRFDSNQYKSCRSIIFHPEWAAYIERHYAIVRGWASWEWLAYMQQMNPSIPALVNKIFMPQQRGSLLSQTKYWKRVLQHKSIECIYSRQLLSLDDIALDHYLPWSFVAHDQLWNLIPVVPSVNSSKSNCLPAQQYFERFVSVQHSGLMVSSEHLERKVWERQVESYINDLRVNNPDDLLNIDSLRKAYETAVLPLLTLAGNQGFTSNWIYRS
jgi:transcriptional regulator with XRE-family HTH domain